MTEENNSRLLKKITVFFFILFCMLLGLRHNAMATSTYTYIGNPFSQVLNCFPGNVVGSVTFDDTVSSNFTGTVDSSHIVSQSMMASGYLLEYPGTPNVLASPTTSFSFVDGKIVQWWADLFSMDTYGVGIASSNNPGYVYDSILCMNCTFLANIYNAPGGWELSAVSTNTIEKNLGSPNSSDSIESSNANAVEYDQPQPQVCVGNPINPGTGNKFQSEADYVGGDGNFVKLIRYYNSKNSTITPFGKGWSSIYHRSLVVGTSVVISTRPNGRVDTFRFDKTFGLWVGDKDVTSKLTAVSNGWQLLLGDDTSENYSASGRLLSIVARGGQSISLSYDSQNRLSNATDVFGHALTFSYDSLGRISSATTPGGKVYTYVYDANFNLVSVAYPNNSTRQYLYENTSFPNALTGIVDENGKRFATFTYDSQGRATSSQHAGSVENTTITYNGDSTSNVIDALGNARGYEFTTQFDLVKPAAVSNQGCSCSAQAYTYDANGFLASKTDFNGIVTAYTRDTRGLELSRTEASGTAQARTITTTWHQTFHLPLTITEPNRITTFTYDAKGNVLTKAVTSGSQTRTWTYTYNTNGQELTATDPNGHTTTKTYNSNGGVATIANALGQVASIPSYDANGRPLIIQDPNGLATTLAYDSRGRLTSRTVGTVTTTYTYDAVGQLTRVTQPDGSYIASTYDAAHRLTGIADNLGNRIAYTLDAMSNRTKEEVFDPANHLAQTRAHIYDSLNRLAQDIGAQNKTTTYGHDGNGNLTSVTDALNHVTHNNFDALNRLVQSTDPTSAVTHVVYNANDLTTGVTDPRSLATSYTYDGLGNRTSTQSPDTGTTSKTYDATGNVLTSTDARGKTTTYAYDALNRPTSATFADGKTVAYQYDQGTYGKGHLTTLTDPSGSTTWGYDLHGRVLQKQQKTGTVTLTTSYAYDSTTGKVSAITYPSGRQLAYTYDTVSKKLASIKVGNSTLVSGITYQPFGPVASWSQGNGKTYGRSFDQDGRLAGIAIGGTTPESVALTYDAAGRITGINDSAAAPKIANTGTTNFQYASTSNRQTGSTGGTAKTYTYDAAGNITGDGSATFTYGASGRLAQVTKGSATTYAINGLGQRVAKSGAGADGGTVNFVYDEVGHLIGEYDASGNAIEETVWLGDLPVGVLKTGAQYYVNPDHLGAPLSITDANGKVVWRWDRDPYGNGKPNENPSGLGTFTYNLRFPGQYYDKETELHYNYYRDYNPKTGRYVQSDPIGLDGGANTYGYVNGNPMIGNDMFGTKENRTLIGKIFFILGSIGPELSDGAPVGGYISTGAQATYNMANDFNDNVVSSLDEVDQQPLQWTKHNFELQKQQDSASNCGEN